MAGDRYRVHRWVNRGVLVGLPALGLLHEQPGQWCASFLGMFALLAGSVLGAAWVVTRWAERGPGGSRARVASRRWSARRHGHGAGDVGDGRLAAWPLTAQRLGEPTGFTWTLEGTGFAAATAIAVTLVGVVGVDAWTYWKHRALHTRWLFGFHRDHHRFRDPTAFAGFAVGPLEALWTFLPGARGVGIPRPCTGGRCTSGSIVGFVLLNLYLHCGVEVGLLERVVPRLGFNTSAFHNVHHSHVRANFGEVARWWDRICGTRQTDLRLDPRTGVGGRSSAKRRFGRCSSPEASATRSLQD